MAEIFGYARTSTVDQDAGLQAQIRDLKAAGCSNVFHEKVSSVAETREQFEAALAVVKPDDVLMVTKMDRLARNTIDLLGIVSDLTGRGVGLIILSMGGQPLDTRSPTGRFMLTILAAVAELERNLMLERQREGIAFARQNGKYKGRPRAGRKENADRVYSMVDSGKKNHEIALELGIPEIQVKRLKADWRAGKAAELLTSGADTDAQLSTAA